MKSYKAFLAIIGLLVVFVSLHFALTVENERVSNAWNSVFEISLGVVAAFGAYLIWTNTWSKLSKTILTAILIGVILFIIFFVWKVGI